MQITKLSIKDFLGLEFFQIDECGEINLITGSNGAGKSSILAAIKEAFKSSGTDPNLIRIGQDKAEIIIELDNKVRLERTITEKSNKVAVKADGKLMSKPVEWLRSVIGDFSFSPVEFFMSPVKRQRELILSAIPFKLDVHSLISLLTDSGLNTSDVTNEMLERLNYDQHGLSVLADLKDLIYNQRHLVGQDVTRLEKSIEQRREDIPEGFSSEKWEGFDFSAKMSAFNAAKDEVAAADKLQERINVLRSHAEGLIARINKASEELSEVQTKGKRLKSELNLDGLPDVNAMKGELDEYEKNQRIILRLDDIKTETSRLAEINADHERLNATHKKISTKVSKVALQKLHLPIANMEILDKTIKVEGVDISKLSDSEKIRFAVAMARSLTKDLKVVCIDGFEVLDESTRLKFIAEIKDDDFEYFITRVGSGDLQVERA